MNHGAATGYLAGRIAELGRRLAGFEEEIGLQWPDMAMVVMADSRMAAL